MEEEVVPKIRMPSNYDVRNDGIVPTRCSTASDATEVRTQPDVGALSQET